MSSIRNHPDPYHPYPYVPSPLSNNSTNRTTLFFEGKGGLGNRIFQLIGIMTLARYYDKKLVIDKEMHSMLNACFDFDARGLTPSLYSVGKIPTNITFYDFNQPSHRFKPQLFHLNNTEDFAIFSYFQSWKYFQHRQEEIRLLFRFGNVVRKKSNATVTNCLKEWNVSRQEITLIGIHVRRGDIAHQQRLAPMSYFRSAMRYFRSEFHNVYFIVCSNDLKWSQVNFRAISNTRVVRNQLEVDLAVLASCDHTIMSIGTFGWWAGWFAGGEVVYYNQQDRMTRELFPANQFYIPGWIPMSGF